MFLAKQSAWYLTAFSRHDSNKTRQNIRQLFSGFGQDLRHSREKGNMRWAMLTPAFCLGLFTRALNRYVEPRRVLLSSGVWVWLDAEWAVPRGHPWLRAGCAHAVRLRLPEQCLLWGWADESCQRFHSMDWRWSSGLTRMEASCEPFGHLVKTPERTHCRCKSTLE